MTLLIDLEITEGALKDISISRTCAHAYDSLIDDERGDMAKESRAREISEITSFSLLGQVSSA